MSSLFFISCLLLLPLIGANSICQELKDCVLCKAFSSSKKCPKPCFPIAPVTKIVSGSNRRETVCKVKDVDNCEVTFVISFKVLMLPIILVEQRKHCSKPELSCISNHTGITCSGHGRCVDGACSCYFGYYGKFCEKCRHCDDYCDDLKYCVQCRVFFTGPLCATNCSGCFQPKLTDYTGVLVPKTDRQCQFVDDDLCTVSFVYSNFGGRREVFANPKKKCPDSSRTIANSETFNSPCIGSNGLYCSARGICLNEKQCKCRKGFYGRHCENCKNCKVSCSDLSPCVLCRIARTGPLCGQDCSQLCSLPVIVDDIWSSNMSSLQRCRTKDDNECSINFAYSSKDKTVYVENKLACRGSVRYVLESIMYAGHILKALTKNTPGLP